MHLFQDLQPYVCTFEHCSQPYKTYASRHEWFHHEAHMHRMHWTCQQCREHFTSKTSFVEHRRRRHSSSSTHEQLSALIDMCSRPADDRSIGKCSLCFKDDQPLLKHMAHHLVSLALFALPHKDDDEANDYGSNQGQAGASAEDSNVDESPETLSESDVMSEISEAANEEIIDDTSMQVEEPELNVVGASAEADTLPNDDPIVEGKADDFWDRAYQTLRDQDLWIAYEKILMQQLRALSAVETTVIRSPLSREQMITLVLKTDVLEDPKWISNSSIETDRLLRTIIFVKESISVGESPDAYAAFAWAGLCVLLPLVVHPLHDSTGFEDIFDDARVLETLDYMCVLVSRLVVIQHLYRLDDIDPNSIPEEASRFKSSFEKQMLLLCSQILKTQAQAVNQLLGLKKPSDESCLPGLLVDLRKLVADCRDLHKIGDHESLKAAMTRRERRMEVLFRSQRQKWQKQRKFTEQAQEEHILVPSREDNKACLNALRTTVYEDGKSLNPDRLPGTCQWVLEHPKYHSWLEGKSSNVLWISADPGHGKSVLLKSLVDWELRSTASATTCYFFFRYDEAQNRSVINALCALLHQLCSQNRALLQRATQAFKSNGGKLGKSFSWLWELLLFLTQCPEAGKVLCLLDGLDECDAKGIEDLQDSLKLHAARKNSDRQLSFLVTSRPCIAVKRVLNSDIIWLVGEDERKAIREEIGVVIHDRGPRIAREMALDYDIPRILYPRILQMHAPNYLWLHLTLVAIEQASGVNGPKRMARFMEHLPRDTNEAYETLLKLSPQLEQASKLLHISIAALRPLTLREMNIALSIKEGQKSHEDLHLRPDESFSKYIADLCGPIIFVNHGKVYLAHQTVKEWWTARTNGAQPRPQWLEPSKKHTDSPVSEISNRLLSKICCIYLSFDVFEDEPPPTDPSEDSTTSRVENAYGGRQRQIIQYAQSHDFLEYAAVHWPYHFRSGGEHDLEMLQRWEWVCQPQSKRFYTWFRVFWYSHGLRNDLEMRTQIPALSLLAVACFLGDLPTVRFLVEKGEELESKRGKGWPPLLTAINQRDTAIASFLVERGASLNSEIVPHWTPLALAAARGLDVFAEYLIQNGVNVEQKTYPLGATALGSASKAGQLPVVEILLRHGASVTTADNRGMTALMEAAARGHEKVTELLLDKGADVQASSNAEWTALHYAIFGAHETLAHLLLSRGALPDTEDENERTPLLLAAQRGLDHATKSLIERGAQVNSTDDEGLTPLLYATRLDHDTVAKELLMAGAHVNTPDEQGQTPLSIAVQRKNQTMTRLLLDQGADTGATDERGMTALLHATKLGQSAIIRMLLEAGADPNVPDEYGQTPLMYESRSIPRPGMTANMSAENISMWHRVGADINAIDKQGRTALSYAAAVKHVPPIRALLDAEADPDIADNKHRTPLHYAVATSKVASAQLLIRAGADLTLRDAEGETPLEMAREREDEELIHIIEEALLLQMY